MSFNIRPAGAADAAEMVRVRHLGWQESYSHLLPAAFLTDLLSDAENRAGRWAARIAANEAAGSIADWVAEDADGRLIGFAATGPARSVHPLAAPTAESGTPLPETPLPEEELYALYLLRRAHGGGAGQALLDAALGGRAAALWVLEDNPRAQAFYRRNGFRPDGAAQAMGPEWQGAREIRMVRR